MLLHHRGPLQRVRLLHAYRAASSAAAPKPAVQEAPAESPEELQLLQRSVVPTMHFQKSLPRLPIPGLDKTIDRYVRAQRPISDPGTLGNTVNAAMEFRNNYGRALHAKLLEVDRNNKHTSYISDYWFDMYLRAREPLVINFAPFIAMNDDPNQAKMDQAVRAADLTLSALRFRNSLRQNLLEPDVYHLNPKKSDTPAFRRFVSLLPAAISWYGAYLYKAFPLDMSQYKNLFNSTRIPRPDKDELYKDDAAKHVAVLRNGEFYTFDVYDANGNILPAKDILNCYRHILKTAPKPNKDSIAVMSADERNRWAAVRARLVQAGNEARLRQLDTALFVLCLDTNDSEDKARFCKEMLHGDGYNRWFDKSFSLIVDAAGRAGVNFEHAWGDGVAVLRFVNEIHKDALNHNFALASPTATSVDPTRHVHHLDFVLNDNIRSEIHAARETFEKSINGLDLSILEYHGYGKEDIKKYHFYPDGMIQLAFQMAYYQLTEGKVAPTYESCSTAAFRHGRTECIRSATPLTQKFCQLYFDTSPLRDETELYYTLRDVSQDHGKLTKEAAMGQGFDRHLFALRKLAEAEGQSLPIFTDPAYARMNHNILSTSTLQSPAIAAGGFAPVVADGYGLGYSCMDHWMGCVAFYFPKTRDGRQFTQALQRAFDGIMKVMSSRPPQPMTK
ncbi:LOW QUALITY PROTEIN: carnitine O-palmitoyltransferase 2, mitochondrial-like [Paramacrobiotus metropolitanus]|uniref:LOW QUALITY PROTEIN: carnitine O-palmitoyltransferase 2, mitochondrial-like n=1 Tax=Paramacrobiotus metropolitanus TaxID=2943436 RepID=UPI002445DE5D|nr:LOW QUALITY PROTEIN: carnitine O-palmitoyltransferase 2, mitochondrial-like [Paramacrobiotus metropolitanus]